MPGAMPVLLAAGWMSACAQAIHLDGADSGDSIPTVPDSQDSGVQPDTDTAGTETGGDTGDTGCGEIAADEAGYTSLFDASSIHAFDITIGETDMAALSSDPGTYELADVTVDGRLLGSVGLKMRGNADQQRWDGKPSFKIALREFGNCDPFASVDHLYLDANSDDPTQAKMVVSAQVLAAGGLVAPIATFATVSVNGESFGLYTSMEPVEGAFVSHHYSEAGVIWEGGDGADFTAAGGDAWNDVDGGGDRDAIDAVSTVVASAGDDFYAQTDTVVDTDQLLTEWAWLAAIGHQGAYPFATKDVYLFAPAVDGRFQFIPWDLDEGWDPAFGWNYTETALGLRCVYDSECTAALRSHIEAALDEADALNVSGIASDAFALSSDAVAADTRRGTTATQVTAARGSLTTSMDSWSSVVRGQLE